MTSIFQTHLCEQLVPTQAVFMVMFSVKITRRSGSWCVVERLDLDTFDLNISNIPMLDMHSSSRSRVIDSPFRRVKQLVTISADGVTCAIVSFQSRTHRRKQLCKLQRGV
ncbi:hypothetical protein F2P81_010057 [Scophthalmus maximus]|uniref:Uncharacterized protein n=1 Tax=Scophthalmus maximus TaxID=52904 RepID=A0A6A4STA3_SCOMX|nr:hypothetical protein F2P81_010057 [Scophthalmus maximus]